MQAGTSLSLLPYLVWIIWFILFPEREVLFSKIQAGILGDVSTNISFFGKTNARVVPDLCDLFVKVDMCYFC
jgi:hypothetical protein